MSETPNLALPLLAAAQAQKHVTHNEALLVIDALLGCALLDRDLAAPPPDPEEGDRYLVPASPIGEWAGKAGQIAALQGGSWCFLAPPAGCVALVVDEGALVVFDGSSWQPATPATLHNLAQLGIGTAADATNRFAAKLNAALWTARGSGEGGTGDLRYTMNKEASGKVLSLLFQTGYSGRAELGLVGDDEVRLKMSADGSAWVEALKIKANGRVGIGVTDPAERLVVAGNVAPGTDNAHSLGTGSARFSAVYAATGVVNSSDLRSKRDVTPLDPALARFLVKAAAPISYRWRVGERIVAPDGAVAERAGRRPHFGWSAQDWAAALAGAEEDAGLLVRTDPDDPDSELGLRPDQITAVLHAALLGLMAEVAELRAAWSCSIPARALPDAPRGGP